MSTPLTSDASPLRIVEPHQQIDDGGLPAPGVADERQSLSGPTP